MSSKMQIGSVVYTDSGAKCAHCSQHFCSPEQNWKEHVVANRGRAAERLNNGQFGEHYQVHEHDEVELAELYCPGCKALLTVEIYLKGEPYRREYQTLESARAAGYDPVAEFRDSPGDWISF